MAKKRSLEAVRERTITKSNALIQQSRFTLSAVEQRIVLYLISKVSTRDKDFQVYEFDIPEFCRVCGVEYNGRSNSDLKAALKTLADKSVWVKVEPERHQLVRWIEEPAIDERRGTIELKLNSTMKPYLLQLKKNFTSYEMLWTLRFKSKYSTRMYELLKSVHYHDMQPRTAVYRVDELKRILDAENYTLWGDFQRRAVAVAVDEINQYSDINVTYEPVKESKAFTAIEFTISAKNTMDVIKLRSDVNKELGIDENQMTLWDELAKKGAVAE